MYSFHITRNTYPGDSSRSYLHKLDSNICDVFPALFAVIVQHTPLLRELAFNVPLSVVINNLSLKKIVP